MNALKHPILFWAETLGTKDSGPRAPSYFSRDKAGSPPEDRFTNKELEN
jgi:hypothetical protein